MAEPVYIVTAYRYGWLSGGGHHVWAGTRLEDAIAHATAGHATSAGKYGLAVYESVGSDRSICHYIPSGRGESEPATDYLRHLADRVGWRIVGSMEDDLSIEQVHEIYDQESSITEAMKRGQCEHSS